MQTSSSFLTSFTFVAVAALAPLSAAAPRQEPAPAPAPAPQEKVPTFQEANALLQQGDVKGAVAAFGRLSAAQPENGQAVFFHAYTLHMSGDLKAAHDRHLDAAKFEAFRPVALYNHACVHALWKEPEAALQSLREAVDAGFANPDDSRYDAQMGYLETDTDLDSLREDARFKALLAELAPMKKLSQLAPERLFDFYVGEWEMVNGETVESLISVAPAFGDRGLRVSMRNPADGAETASSFFVYDAENKQWRQTWMSAEGQTITMAGGRDGETIALRVETDTKGDAKGGRAVFSDVTRGTFNYAWQTTTDDGKTWTNQASRTFKRRG
jgi:hypothetical protein